MNERSVRPLIAETGRRNESVILNAALDIFGERGFNGASMRDIARRAGTALSNLYNYFPAKADLLAELLRRANDELLRRTTEAVASVPDGDPARALAAAVRAYVGFVVDHQTAALVALSEMRYLKDEQRASVVRARDSTQAIFEKLVGEGAARGVFHTPHPADAARNIVAQCSAISTWYRPDGRLSADALAGQHARYALAMLEAEMPEPG
ncbi:TetR/AcrR family transcriptional regulator [Amycolatopsis sp.]|uniref:TetR/AcrR family transcriptional regulator n=1 Tax=Amycolatopsis sp. TaxID=37632 RepID=UPI002C8755DC|nr:TetR/AcrR family transcriptional regulator [Amycolatopsis sp.]HVV07849.1 TetR/AcrR family transcriptional regulator [Amycolatopsis sp.]